MKKLTIYLTMLLILSVFSGCGIPNGESIEDCMSIGNCYYLDKDVKVESSELSSSLRNLLIDESDEMYFSYMINPGGDAMSLVYHNNGEMTNSSLDQLILLTAQMVEVVNQYYEIDAIETSIIFEEHIEIIVSHDQELNVSYLVAEINFDNSNLDSESQIISYLEENQQPVKFLLDYEEFDRIWWYEGGITSIYIEKDGSNIIIYRMGIAYSDAIDTKISDLLDEYEFSFAESN
jgi:hypothetical protein